MPNWGIVFGLIAVSALILVIASISIPGLMKYADEQSQKSVLESIAEDKKLMCGMPDELGAIFSSVGIISSENFDHRAKGIYQQMQWGMEIESCDVVYFHGQLDAEQKDKLNWTDFSCDVPQC